MALRVIAGLRSFDALLVALAVMAYMIIYFTKSNPLKYWSCVQKAMDIICPFLLEFANSM